MNDKLVIYAYTYNHYIENSKTTGRLEAKVGDTSQGLDEGLTIDESGRLRISQQGDASEAYKKAIIGTWEVSTKVIRRDYVLHRIFKKEGRRPETLDGKGQEWFLFDGDDTKDVFKHVSKTIKKLGQSPNKKLKLRSEQKRVLKETDKIINDTKSDRVDVAWYLPPRFGKTTAALMQFLNSGKKIMILPSAWLSTHTSFQDDSLSFRDFDNMIYVKTKDNPNYKKEIEDAFNKKQKVIVSVSLFAKDKKYFKSLKDISNGDKFVCVDEGDFAAWTPNKRNILDYILNGDKKGKMIVITMSGTNVTRMVTGSDKIDGVVQSTYMALEQTEKDIVKRSFVKMQLSNTDEYVKKLTVNDMFSWTKVWANPYKSENFIKNFLLGVTGNSDNQSYKDLNLSVMMEQPVNCLMLFGSGTKKTMTQFKEIAKKSLSTWRIEVLDSDHTSNNMAKEQITIAINEAKNQNKEGLLIISNTMGSRSFSISEIQSTMICYDKGGIDPTVQKISRSLTPGKLWNGETKKTGYIATFSIDSNRDDTAVKLLTEEAAIQSQNTKQSLPKTIKQLLNNVSILSTDEYGNRIEMVEDKLIEEMSSSKVLKKVALALCKPENILKDDILLNKLLSMNVGKSSKSKEDTQLPKGKNFASVDKKTSSTKQKSVMKEVFRKLQMLCDTSSMVAVMSNGKTYRECLKNIDKNKFKDIYNIDTKDVLKMLDDNCISETNLDMIVANTNNVIKTGDINKFQELDTVGEYPQLGIVNSTEKDLWIKELKQIKNIKKLKIASVGTYMGHEVSALLEIGVPKENITVIDKDGFSKLWNNAGIKYYNKPIEEVNEMKFDLVIGNPPYQSPTSQRKLWTKFIVESFKIAKRVAFITPKRASQMLSGLEVDQVSLTDYFVEYYNGYDVDKHFEVGSDFCFFVISKTPTENFIVKTENGNELWKQGSYIPYVPNSIVQSIISKTMNFKNDYGRSAARVEDTGTGTYRAISKITKDGPVWTTTNKTHKDTNKYKMIYPTLGQGYYLDTVGEVMPTTSFAPYIVVDTKKELNELVKLQESIVFKFLEKSFNTMRSPKDYVWKNIKKGDFKLTKKEMEYINKHVG